jgi:hypothetical protein
MNDTAETVSDSSSETGYRVLLAPAAMAALRGFCEKYRSTPQYGFGGFVSNGQIETVKLVTNQPPPGPFRASA